MALFYEKGWENCSYINWTASILKICFFNLLTLTPSQCFQTKIIWRNEFLLSPYPLLSCNPKVLGKINLWLNPHKHGKTRETDWHLAQVYVTQLCTILKSWCHWWIWSPNIILETNRKGGEFALYFHLIMLLRRINRSNHMFPSDDGTTSWKQVTGIPQWRFLRI